MRLAERRTASSFNIYYFFDRNGPGEKVQAFPQGLRVSCVNNSNKCSSVTDVKH